MPHCVLPFFLLEGTNFIQKWFGQVINEARFWQANTGAAIWLIRCLQPRDLDVAVEGCQARATPKDHFATIEVQVPQTRAALRSTEALVAKNRLFRARIDGPRPAFSTMRLRTFKPANFLL
jgi:hypothetical protein